MAEVEVLPWLPARWLEGIAAGDYVQRKRGAVANSKAAFKWLKQRPEPTGEPCKQMDRSLQVGLSNLEESSSGAAHDELTIRLYELISLSIEGHRGVHTAIVTLGRAFVYEVATRRRSAILAGDAAGTVRTEEEARREVARAVVGAVRLMVGHLSQPEMVSAGMENGAAACGCWDEPVIGVDSEGNEIRGDSGVARDPYEYEFTDTGNAEQLIDLADGRLKWVAGEAAWFTYDRDAGLWVRGNGQTGIMWARRIAPRVKAAAEQRYRAAETASTATEGDGKSDAELLLVQGTKLWKWAEKCGSRSALTNLLEVAKSYDDLHLNAEALDGDPTLLHVGEGNVLELKDAGVHVRKAKPEDSLTRSTSVPYVEGATDPLWEDYLDTFIPDLELRGYLQRLLGYSLLGRNPERLLVFLQGPTSSGKSTIVEAAGAALGNYSGTFGMSVFRENQDDAPRPDLLKILGLRLALASEVGGESRLHADQIKRLVGGDTISARAMRSDVMVQRVPQFTPFVAANRAPRINGADAALMRRLVVVPFTNQVGEEGVGGVVGKPVKADDKAARDALRTSPLVRAAVLAWMVQGYEDYRRNGLDARPKLVRIATAALFKDLTEEHAWLYACCEFTPNGHATADELFNSYRTWALTNGVDKIKSAGSFGMWLTDQGVQKAKQVKVEGKNTKVRVGIRLRKP